MKLRFIIAAAVVLILGQRFCSAQGFVNLNFEAANVLGFSPGSIPATNGIPGWTGYIGSTSTDIILFNTVSLGDAAISLQGPGSLEPILQGNYSVLFQSSFGGATGAAIAEIGQIPINAASVVFFERNFGSFVVTFAGQTIPLVKIGNGTGYDIVSGDISSFAGQTGELRFSTAPNSSGGILDNIQFSSSSIPEPTEFAFVGLSGLFVGVRRWRRVR
jgi:hypothetical protein